MKKLIVANWKMNPATLAEAQGILESVDDFLSSQEARAEELSLVFCPPFVFTEEVAKILQSSHLAHRAQLGAQDIAMDDTGAMTGEVSGPMLTKLGVQYVIIGHSERRWKLGESDDVVNKKLKAALRNELIPIVCLGERTRNTGPPAGGWQDFLRQQTTATFAGLLADDVGRCLVAYEPVWAISTTPGARPDTPVSALQSVGIIRDRLATSYKLQATSFLYGGSITAVNVGAFLAVPEFSGVLVGGASVNKEEFVKILGIAVSVSS